MSDTTAPESGIEISGTSSHFLEPTQSGDHTQGRLRYVTGGKGAPLVLLHTVRTQAEHFRHLIPLVQDRYTVYALDLPGMGYSEIVPGASYEEPAMRAAVETLLTQVDLRDVTLLGESMGATLALTAAADLPLAPGVGRRIAAVEPKPIMRAVLRGGLGDKTALRDDYLEELLQVGRRPGYPTVARGVYGNLPSLIAARSRYREVIAPVHLVYGQKDWSRPSDRDANRQLLPNAEFTEVPRAGHFIALERPDVPADLLNSVA